MRKYLLLLFCAMSLGLVGCDANTADTTQDQTPASATTNSTVDQNDSASLGVVLAQNDQEQSIMDQNTDDSSAPADVDSGTASPDAATSGDDSQVPADTDMPSDTTDTD